MKRFTYGLLALLVLTASCRDARIKEHKKWEELFARHGIRNGCFMLKDQTHETVHFVHKDRCLERFSPASSFKIFLSLVGLETAIAPDEHLVIPWDGKQHEIADWNRDLDMREAFKVSSEPYYQELARRIGMQRMKFYVDSVRYGNMKIDTIDRFWVNNSLQVSADEQVGIIKRIYFDELKPFSARTQRIVRTLMLRDDQPRYKVSYKTGWTVTGSKSVYWVVGFAETITKYKENSRSMNKTGMRTTPYFFAENFEVPAGDTSRNWQQERIAVLYDILKEYGALPQDAQPK